MSQLNPQPPFNLLEFVLYALFAASGGFLGHTTRTIEKHRPFSLGLAIVEAGSSGFLGVLTLLACKAMHFDEMWTGVIVGTLAWCGASATGRTLERVISRRLAIDPPTDGEDANGG